MSKPFVVLRNTISKQTTEYPADKAERILAHPVWGKINEEVRVAKPEVLSQPHTIDDKGERKPLPKEEK